MHSADLQQGMGQCGKGGARRIFRSSYVDFSAAAAGGRGYACIHGVTAATNLRSLVQVDFQGAANGLPPPATARHSQSAARSLVRGPLSRGLFEGTAPAIERNYDESAATRHDSPVGIIERLV